MKKSIRFAVCAALLITALMSFSACSNQTVWKCTTYQFTAEDGSEMDITNALNLLRLTLNKDGTCVMEVATPTEAKNYDGKWSEKDGVITTKINADWSMSLTKKDGNLVCVRNEYINDKNGVATIIFQKA